MYISRIDYSILSPFGSIRFSELGGGYFYYIPRSAEEAAFIEGTSMYREGIIFKQGEDTAPVAEVEVVELVTNCKQAMEWLVQNKGVKRGVFSREQLIDKAKELGVEFPNLPQK